MPRSGAAKKKAKNAGVGIAFKKAKHKVGKKLPKAQNATDTNFKSKAITLPGQSVGEDKGNAVTNKNLTLKDLLTQVGHYSGKVRAEALTEMAQLIEAHPQELGKQVAVLMAKLCERFADPEKPVRAALLRLLVSQILPQLRDGKLLPFIPLIMAHISGAMTHIDNDIRADGMRYLDAMVGVAPKQISDQYVIAAIQHYCQLLSEAGRSQTLSSSTQKHLLQTLRSLCNFLSKMEAVDDESVDWPQPAAKRRKVDHNPHSAGCQLPASLFSEVWDNPLQHDTTQARHSIMSWAELCTKDREKSILYQASNAEDTLRKSLEKAWLSCAAESRSPDVSVATVQCMEFCVLSILHLLKRKDRNRQDTVWDPYEYPHLYSSYLPMSAPAGTHSSDLQQAIVRLNLAGMQLFEKFLEMNSDGIRDVPGWIWCVFNYQCGLMSNGIVLPVEDSITSETKQPNVPAQMYTIILSGTGVMLEFLRGYQDARKQFLEAMWALFQRSRPTSSAKLACLKFMAEVCQGDDYTMVQRSINSDRLVSFETIASWLKAMPKLLWELGDKAPAASHLILEMLNNALRYMEESPVISDQLAALQDEMSVFLAAEIVSDPRQSRKIKGKGPGPSKRFVSIMNGLPAATKELAVDSLYYHGTVGSRLFDSLVLICLRPEFSLKLAERVINMLAARAKTTLPSYQLTSLFLRLLKAGGDAGCIRAEFEMNSILEYALQSLVSRDNGETLSFIQADLIEVLQMPQHQHRHFLALTSITRLSEPLQSLQCSTGKKTAISEDNPLHENVGDEQQDMCSLELPSRLETALPATLANFVSSQENGGKDSSETLDLVAQLLVQHPQLLPQTLCCLSTIHPVSNERGNSAHTKPEVLCRQAQALDHFCRADSFRANLSKYKSEVQQSVAKLWSRAQVVPEEKARQACQRLKSTTETLYGSQSAD